MAAGLGLLGYPPDVFWGLTPSEFEAALNGRVGVGGRVQPFTRRDLDRLMRTYPDAPRSDDRTAVT